MNKNKVGNIELLNASKENSLMVGLDTYHRAMSNLNNANLQWLNLVCLKKGKSETKFLYKQFDRCMDAAYGSLIDALSCLCYLHDTNNLTNTGISVVEGTFEFCMAKKNLRPIIKRACKKNKHSTLNNLYKKYKKKVKVEK